MVQGCTEQFKVHGELETDVEAKCLSQFPVPMPFAMSPQQQQPSKPRLSVPDGGPPGKQDVMH